MIMASQKQGGASIFFVLVFLIALGLIATVGLRLFPVYMENYKVKTALESLHEDTSLVHAPSMMIRKRIMRRLDINDVKRVEAKDIAVKDTPSGRIVTIKYEARVPVFLNLDAVAKFSAQTEVASH